ncbi:MAG: hypothetical protein U1E76_20540 [Planctomycetota bacterium]
MTLLGISTLWCAISWLPSPSQPELLRRLQSELALIDQVAAGREAEPGTQELITAFRRRGVGALDQVPEEQRGAWLDLYLGCLERLTLPASRSADAKQLVSEVIGVCTAAARDARPAPDLRPLSRVLPCCEDVDATLNELRERSKWSDDVWRQANGAPEFGAAILKSAVGRAADAKRRLDLLSPAVDAAAVRQFLTALPLDLNALQAQELDELVGSARRLLAGEQAADCLQSRVGVVTLGFSERAIDWRGCEELFPGSQSPQVVAGAGRRLFQVAASGDGSQAPWQRGKEISSLVLESRILCPPGVYVLSFADHFHYVFRCDGLEHREVQLPQRAPRDAVMVDGALLGGDKARLIAASSWSQQEADNLKSRLDGAARNELASLQRADFSIPNKPGTSDSVSRLLKPALASNLVLLPNHDTALILWQACSMVNENLRQVGFMTDEFRCVPGEAGAFLPMISPFWDLAQR